MDSKAPNAQGDNAGKNSERAHLDLMPESVKNVGLEGPTVEGPVVECGNGESDSTTTQSVVKSGLEEANNMECGNQERGLKFSNK